MTVPGDSNPLQVTEVAILAKYDQDTTGMTEDQIAELEPVETITLRNGEVVRTWSRGDEGPAVVPFEEV